MNKIQTVLPAMFGGFLRPYRQMPESYLNLLKPTGYVMHQQV